MGSLEEPPGAAFLNPAEAELAGQQGTWASTGSGATLCFSWSTGRGEAGPGGGQRDAQILPLPGKCTVGNSFSGALGVY